MLIPPHSTHPRHPQSIRHNLPRRNLLPFRVIRRETRLIRRHPGRLEIRRPVFGR